MSTDRELLELAAKAAGILVVRSRLDDPMTQDFLIQQSARNDDQRNGPWNPLADDGDALRLAVKLRMMLDDIRQGYMAGHVVAVGDGPNGSHYEPREPDPYAATRRAIVCAAAELGRAM